MSTTHHIERSEDGIPAKLITAFSEGMAETWYRSYRQAMAATELHGPLIATTNAVLTQMKRRKTTAYAVCKDLLPQLETETGRRMAMAAATLVVLHGLPAGRKISMLPRQAV